MRKILTSRWFSFLLLLLTVVVFWQSLAWARAGGGGGYSGGGGGGGGGFGGGGGSDGDAFIFQILLYLILEQPAIGIPLTIVAIVCYVYLHKTTKGAYESNVIHRGAAAREELSAVSAAGTIAEGDPDFDAGIFTDRVTKAFEICQKAWCEQKLEPIRPFVSDAIVERWTLQLEEQKDLGYRDHMEQLTIQDVRIVQVEEDAPFHVMTVRIRARAVDYRVSLKDGKRIHGSSSAESFVEYWSFLRRTTGKTQPGKSGLIEGNCPNCGAAIAMNAAAKCEHCGALLRSGEYDWVLAEITQACEWTGESAAAVAGVSALRLKDIEFNVQHLEDRASVAFWRKAMADRAGSVKPLAQIASVPFAKGYGKKLKAAGKEDGSRSYLGECAVGSVRTLGVMADEHEEKAVVEVRWNGTVFSVDSRGDRKNSGDRKILRSIMLFWRKGGTQTKAAEALSSAHCPGCGAPEKGQGGNSCEYCGAVLNDGSRDWVLADFQPWSSDTAQGWVKDLRAAGRTPKAAGGGGAGGTAAPMAVIPSSAALLAWMIEIMLADGVMDDKEQAMLNKVAQKHAVPDPLLQAMIESCKRKELETPEPEDQEQARSWLSAMARMALADGKIDGAERDLLLKAGQRLGMMPYDVKMLLKREKAALYRQAKGEIKAIKSQMRKKTFE